MKKVTLITLFLMCLTFAVKAQDLSKQILGKWTLSDVKLSDKAGEDLKKMTSEQKEQLEKMKEMFLKNKMVQEFMADGTMILSGPYGDDKRNWKIVGKELQVKNKEGKRGENMLVKIKNDFLELVTELSVGENASLVFILKKTK